MATITCVRCGRESEPMEKAPTGGRLGEAVLSHVCPACWKQWDAQSVMIVNHYGLQLADRTHRQELTRMMKEFLNLPEL